ncbi:MAG: hydrolase [Bdellovibrionales bacterium CG11_big_fil_rev_8_21_14_0_20_38_13]|nr:MAG: hydrolase [Bdellovibrionales bacterium CG11_big_fil_rev_8_21_14_0_20_38_13]
MEIRDPVHGSIHISEEIAPIIRHPFFQRLRNIKQLGLTEYIFPGATHTRFIHSIGVMHIGSKVFDKLFAQKLSNPDIIRLKETFKLGCLLHDIGHAPLSHSTESVMPTLAELKIPKEFLDKVDFGGERQATHEDYTIKSIADSSFSESFKDVEAKYGVLRSCIADVIRGSTHNDEYFTVEGVNWFPILHQLVSSELDCDRMDYLLRDSYFCGVSYGSYDLDWLIDNLEPCFIDGKAVLGISERAVVTFDDFLLSRYHMFVMVYFHYRAVCLEQLLLRYFQTSDEYRIPADIEEYQEHDDHYLMKFLRKSSNKYAKSIVLNEIPKKVYESFNQPQLNTLEQIQTYLEQQKIEFIRCSSKGRLSKYYQNELIDKSFSLRVVRKTIYGDTTFTSIDTATDLYKKFSTSHAVNRLHFNLKDLTKDQLSHVQGLIKE